MAPYAVSYPSWKQQWPEKGAEAVALKCSGAACQSVCHREGSLHLTVHRGKLSGLDYLACDHGQNRSKLFLLFEGTHAEAFLPLYGHIVAEKQRAKDRQWKMALKTLRFHFNSLTCGEYIYLTASRVALFKHLGSTRQLLEQLSCENLKVQRKPIITKKHLQRPL